MDDVVRLAMNELKNGINAEKIEVYNEASAQHELAYILRAILGEDYRVYLERNISHCGLEKWRFLKKEMDILIEDRSRTSMYCIEIKYPTSGQYPEQMFKACRDVSFLEQLKESGFKQNYFIFVSNDPNFYNDWGGSLIIVKPTGSKDEEVTLKGEYTLKWEDIRGPLRWFMVRI